MRPTAILLAAALAAAATAPAAARDAGTLADMRREMAVLSVELFKLRQEMSTTGVGAALSISGDLLQRIDQIEAELSRLTSSAEEMSFRIDNIVSDGTNRLGDMEFRLCELDPDCDIATLPRTSVLGGGEPPGVPFALAPTGGARSDIPELAIGESRDYEQAKAALEEGDPGRAALILEDFESKYPGSPLLSETFYLRGEAHALRFDWKNAARAYLDAFSGAPEGPFAADSLIKLGGALAELGQTDEACVMLSEVELRFPEHPARDGVAATMRRLNCL